MVCFGRRGCLGEENGVDADFGRPYYLVDNMDEGPLKDKLESCKEGPFSTSSFSISHRGAALMFPEHSKEGYEAAIRMGAGVYNLWRPPWSFI